jgi:hypothetical protein
MDLDFLMNSVQKDVRRSQACATRAGRLSKQNVIVICYLLAVALVNNYLVRG